LRRSDTMRSAPHSRPLSLHDALPISAEDTIHQKEGPANFVTDFDTEIQKFLISGLKKILPEAEFFGEEDTEENKGASASGEYTRSEEHTSELQSRFDLVCRLLLEKKK